MTVNTWISLCSSSIGFVAGSLFLKRYADLGKLSDLSYAFAIFAASNLLYAQLLARGLGQGTALSSMAQIVLMSVVGLVVFGERMNSHQIGGLTLACLSIFVFARA